MLRKNLLSTIMVLLLALSLIFSSTMYGFAQPTNSAKVTKLSLKVGDASLVVDKDGVKENIALDAVPEISNERTFLPIRQVIEALGGSVAWTPTEQKAEIALNSREITLWINLNYALIDKERTRIDADSVSVKPYIAPPGRVMLPLRFVTEGLGAEVAWDAKTATIVITYVKPATDPTPTTKPVQTAPPSNGNKVDPSSITDKVITGYQGWFTASGDGSSVARWKHWSETKAPAPGFKKQTFEMYPDISDYGASQLFQTDYANFGDGRPAQLYSSYPAETVNLHFSWMQQYGIEGAALQRFCNELLDPGFLYHRNSIATKVKNAAEEYGRMFYVMYDISGMPKQIMVEKLKEDWTQMVTGSLKLTSSPQYARQDGKPVVNLWGIGFSDRPGTAEECLELINWFKAQGCYVIGGVPTNWVRSNGDSKRDFQEVYKAYDMISPWTIGRYGDTDASIDNHKQYLKLDMEYCKENNLAYQPVVFAGFAWSNWNSGAPNSKPRRQGKLFWRQAYNIKDMATQHGMNQAMYMAMFDEYDEGTALAKAAEDSTQIPTDQYFLTLSADGAFVSSDFYLRLAGAATRMIKGLDPMVLDVPIPLSNGPVYFRTSLEHLPIVNTDPLFTGALYPVDVTPTWTNEIDPAAGGSSGVSGIGSAAAPTCTTSTGEAAHRGKYSVKVAGKDNSDTSSYANFKVFDVDVPVTKDTKLSFWTNPKNDLGKYVSVDLVMTDGTTLKDTKAVDYNNVSMHPSAGRGAVGSWTQIKCDIGKWLDGKTIDKIVISYDHGPETGEFTTYIDDIVITTGEIKY